MNPRIRQTCFRFIFTVVLLIGVLLQPMLIQVSGQYPYAARHRLTIQVNNSVAGTTLPSPGYYYYDHGLSVQVIAQPNAGYVFNGWYLNGVYQHRLSTITVTMLRDNVLTASFSQQTASLTISVKPAEGGTTNPPAGTLSFPIASHVQVTAQPNPGYVFNGWYLDGEFKGTDTRITVTLTGNQQLQAYFGGTTAPTPTPAPLPKAAIDVSAKSSATYSGFAVEITGALSGGGAGLAGGGVLLYLSVSGGASWDVLSYVNTDADGKFTVVWRPSVTGNYLLNATFLGNSEYSATSKVVNFALTPYADESVFSVTSNSTLSGLIFDSQSSLLSFNVTGPSGTTGYVNAIIPKTLISSISNLKVYLDGIEWPFETISQADSWAVTFTYQHSSHAVVINLNAPPYEPRATEQLRNLLPYIVPVTIIIIVLVVVALVITRRRKAKKS